MTQKKSVPATLSLLSSLYLCKPSKEAIANWKIFLSENTSGFLFGLEGALHKIDHHSGQVMDDLLWEYTRLFVGPYKLPCPPWESVYASPKRLLMQSAYDRVQDCYREIGLAVSGFDIMPDHIGAELNFLAILYGKIIQGGKKEPHFRALANKFMDEHLLRWIPQFTQDMASAAHSVFYKELAQTTNKFIFWLSSNGRRARTEKSEKKVSERNWRTVPG